MGFQIIEHARKNSGRQRHVPARAKTVQYYTIVILEYDNKCHRRPYLFLDVESKDMKLFSNNRFPTTYIQIFRNNTVRGS